MQVISQWVEENNMNPIQSLIETRQEAIGKELVEKLPTKCFVGLSENEAETVMALVDNFVQAHHTQTIIALLEAQCALWEESKSEAIKLGARADEVGPKFHWTGRVTALTEIIASNHELLKLLQS